MTGARELHGGSIRASDLERDRAAAVLREAYAAGRLTLDEFHERAGAVYSARARGELWRLTADLPESGRLFRDGSHVEVHYEQVELRPARKRPCWPVWLMAAIWLVIAAAAHVAAAVPLVLLAALVLYASRWN